MPTNLKPNNKVNDGKAEWSEKVKEISQNSPTHVTTQKSTSKTIVRGCDTPLFCELIPLVSLR